jgi:hypothetical protein
MKPEWGQFFMTQRGQFRVAFDTAGGGVIRQVVSAA